MDSNSPEIANWLPLILLGLRTAFKCTVDKRFDSRIFAHALAEMPVDALFVALSLFAAYVILPGCAAHGLFWFVGVLAFTLIASVVSRVTKDLYDAQRWLGSFIFWLPFVSVSIWFLMKAISLLIEAH